MNNIIKYSNISATARHDRRHNNNTISLDYTVEDGTKFINYLYSNCTIYLDRKYKLFKFFKQGSRSVEEFTELLQTNIGKIPEKENTEITSDNKKSEVSYSVEIEPFNMEE